MKGWIAEDRMEAANELAGNPRKPLAWRVTEVFIIFGVLGAFHLLAVPAIGTMFRKLQAPPPPIVRVTGALTDQAPFAWILLIFAPSLLGLAAAVMGAGRLRDRVLTTLTWTGATLWVLSVAVTAISLRRLA